LRAILDAVFYVLKSGCPWRLLPKDFPPWKTVYDWFRRWRIDGTWERLNTELRERLRCRLGRDPNPSAGIVDSQSVRTTGVGGTEQRGFDPAKKVEGILSLTYWWTPKVWCSKPRYTAPKFQTKMESGCCWTQHAIAFHAFRTCGSMPATPREGHRRWAEEVLGLSVEVVRKPKKPLPENVAKRWAEEWAKEGIKVDWQRLMPPRGFQVLPRRWVVERTIAWICHNRRMAKDYERLCATGEAFVYAAMTRLMVRRLARA
jgi:putative transposase